MISQIDSIARIMLGNLENTKNLGKARHSRKFQTPIPENDGDGLDRDEC